MTPQAGDNPACFLKVFYLSGWKQPVLLSCYVGMALKEQSPVSAKGQALPCLAFGSVVAGRSPLATSAPFQKGPLALPIRFCSA